MKWVLKKQVRLEQSPSRVILIDDRCADFYECSESAYVLLKGLIKGATRKGLVQMLRDVYELNEPEAVAQVEQCLSLLMAVGMLDEQA